HHGVHTPERQRREVGAHVGERVRGSAVRDGGLVVVDRDHPGTGLLQDPGTVALTRAGLHDVLAGTAWRQPAVHDLMAGEPVLLPGDAGHGPFTGQGQRGGHVPKATVGVRGQGWRRYYWRVT